MGDFRFFMCEPGVLTPMLIEKYCPDHGLIHLLGMRKLKVIIQAPRRTLVDKDAEIRYLRFAIINNKSPVQACMEDALVRENEDAEQALPPNGS